MYVVQTRIIECRKALEAITGKDFGGDKSAWLKWWDNRRGKPVNSLLQELPNDPLSITDPRSLEQLEIKAKSQSLFDRSNAMVGLGLINDKRSIEILIAALKEEKDPNPIMWACKSLEQLGALASPPVQTILMEKLNSNIPSIAGEVSRCLVMANEPNSVELILSKNKPQDAARIAASLYKKYPAKEQVLISALANLINSPDKQVRMPAAESLGKIHTEEAISLLQERRKRETDSDVLVLINCGL